jgi:hypothetical protein
MSRGHSRSSKDHSRSRRRHRSSRRSDHTYDRRRSPSHDTIDETIATMRGNANQHQLVLAKVEASQLAEMTRVI